MFSSKQIDRSASSFGSPVATHPRLPVASSAGRTPHGNVRRRGRDRWQARIYVGGRKGGAVHLGMYESETAAEQVAKKVLKTLMAAVVPPVVPPVASPAPLPPGGGPVGPSRCRGTAGFDPLDVWKAARKLADGGWDVGGQLSCLLPRWVCLDGRGGYGYRVRGGNGCDRGGFGSVDAAYAEAVRVRREVRRRYRRKVRRMVQLSLLGLLSLGVEIGVSAEAGETRASGKTDRSVRRGKTERNVSRSVQLTFGFDGGGEVEVSDGGIASRMERGERSGVGREIVA